MRGEIRHPETCPLQFRVAFWQNRRTLPQGEGAALDRTESNKQGGVQNGPHSKHRVSKPNKEMGMKRTLIALAVGAAFAAPAAYADVTLSGSINAGPAVVKSGDGSTNASNSISATGGTAQQGITRTGINTNYTNITIGSMEDLGGGLKLDF